MRGQSETAIETLTQAGGILSHHVPLYLALGDAYAAVGKKQDAEKAWVRSGARLDGWLKTLSGKASRYRENASD